MSIDPNDPRITAYAFGELEGDSLREFEAELDASEALRSEVAETRSAVEKLGQELHTEPLGSMTNQQQTELASAIHDRPTPHSLPPGRSHGQLLAGMCIGSIATLLMVALFVYGGPANRSINDSAGEVALRSSKSVASARDNERADEEDSDSFNGIAISADGVAPSSAQAGQKLQAPSTKSLATTLESVEKQVPGEATPSLDFVGAAKTPASPGAVTVTAGSLSSARPAPSAPRAANQNWGLEAGKNLGRADRSTARPEGEALAMNYKSVADKARKEARFTKKSEADPFAADESLGRLGWENGVQLTDEGRGPGFSGDKFDLIEENEFKDVFHNPLSTFSIDVDTASYSKMRMFLMERAAMPRRDSVRIEELVNYFSYDYQPPQDDKPFAAHMEISECPWQPGHRLARVAIKGKEISRDQRPKSNLVFLLDVSGSMSRPNKLPLLKRGMKMLVEQLGEDDQVAIAVYARAAGLVLDSTSGEEKTTIMESLDRLSAGGSTAGGAGIKLAYQVARDNFIKGGVNRVILCTDGDFNVGTTGTDQLVQLVQENAKSEIFLSVLGFGMGNHNDSMLEQISNKGNGNYAFIDTEAEARKVLVEQMSGTLVTIAKDVKIQIEFNPKEVAAYRLIGYENRILAAEDFNDDKKDAGEIGTGHTVTALYEIIPTGSESKTDVPDVDELRFQTKAKLTKDAASGEILVLKLRYKLPEEDKSKLLTFPISDEGKKFGQTTKDFRFAAAVASFGMLLRDSKFKGESTYAAVHEIASEAGSDDQTGYRAEFLQIVDRAKQVSGQP